MARAGRELPIGIILERSLRWGLPVAPLFTAMLQVLSTTPSSLPPGRADTLYLACMLGALFGVAYTALPKGTPGQLRALCLIAMATLEAAWIVLTIGGRGDLPAYTAVGMFLAGTSTSSLLCLWLSVGQERDARCEIVKLAIALMGAFVFNTILDVAPYLNYIGFALPLLTGIPLLQWLQAKDTAAPNIASAKRMTADASAPHMPRAATNSALDEAGRMSNDAIIRLSTLPLLAAFGAGMGVLGHGGAIVNYGVALSSVVLFCPLLLKGRAASVIGKCVAPLTSLGILLSLLFESGAPYSIFLTGCVAYEVWLWVDWRGREHGLIPLRLRSVAGILGISDTLVMLGLVVGQLALQSGFSNMYQSMVFICIYITIFNLLWQIITSIFQHTHDSAAKEKSCSLNVDERELGQAFGLSAREAQVACLLCENRSVNYVCARLELSRSTVKTHVRHIYEKAGVHSKDELQLLVSDRNRKEGA